MGRGNVTPEVRERIHTLLGVQITDRLYLSLMAYLQYVLMNDQRIDHARISCADRKLLADWRKKGWIDGGKGEVDLKVSRFFWDAMSEILYLSYVVR